jgi:hypothetical protein
MYEGRSVKAVMNVTNGPEETSDQARMERRKDGLPVLELSARDSAAFVEALFCHAGELALAEDHLSLPRAHGEYEELGQERPEKIRCGTGGRLYAKAYFTALYALEYI